MASEAGQGSMGRRTFIRRAAVGAGIVGAVALVPGIAARQLDGDDRELALVSREDLESVEPVMVYVRDAARGEAVVLWGEAETVITDRGLVASLLHARESVA